MLSFFKLLVSRQGFPKGYNNVIKAGAYLHTPAMEPSVNNTAKIGRLT